MIISLSLANCQHSTENSTKNKQCTIQSCTGTAIMPSQQRFIPIPTHPCKQFFPSAFRHCWHRRQSTSSSSSAAGLVNKTVRYGFLTNYKRLEYLFESSDTTLFSAILRRPDHVLHPLLPPLKTTGYHLRQRSHGLKLSAVQSSLLRENFIYRMLYTDIYCLFYHTVYFWICYILFLLLFLYFNLYILM